MKDEFEDVVGLVIQGNRELRPETLDAPVGAAQTVEFGAFDVQLDEVDRPNVAALDQMVDRLQGNLGIAAVKTRCVVVEDDRIGDHGLVGESVRHDFDVGKRKLLRVVFEYREMIGHGIEAVNHPVRADRIRKYRGRVAGACTAVDHEIPGPRSDDDAIPLEEILTSNQILIQAMTVDHVSVLPEFEIEVLQL